ALLVHRAGAVGRVVAAGRLDPASLVVRGLRPYLLRKDSELVRLARQTGGRGEGRKPSLSCHCPPYLPTPWTSPPPPRSPPSLPAAPLPSPSSARPPRRSSSYRWTLSPRSWCSSSRPRTTRGARRRSRSSAPPPPGRSGPPHSVQRATHRCPHGQTRWK